MNNPTLALIDIEARRFSIRQLLEFEFLPLAGKGNPYHFRLSGYDSAVFRPVVEELLVAFAEYYAGLTTESAVATFGGLKRFCRYLASGDADAIHRQPVVRMTDISFDVQAGFEIWLKRQSPTSNRRSYFDMKAMVLKFVASGIPFPIAKKTGRVDVSRLGKMIGIGDALRKYAELTRIVASAAETRNQSLLVTSRIDRPAVVNVNAGLAPRTVNNSCETLSVLLRHIERTNRDALAPDFTLRAVDRSSSTTAVKSKALLPQEREALRAACMSAVRSIRRRLLIERSELLARGRAMPSLGEAWAAWGSDAANLAAYVEANLPRTRTINKNHWVRPEHRDFLLACQANDVVPSDITKRLWPDRLDLAPFMTLIGMSDHAPINLSGLLNLCVGEGEVHCLQPSPTPNHKRLYFGKARAGLDRTFLDVPARGDFDIPGLIDTVIAITTPLRQAVPEGMRHRLWLHTLEGGRQPKPISQGHMDGLLASMIADLHVRVDGVRLSGVHFRRLRTTAVADLALETGLEAARARAAHADPVMTAAYALNPTSEPRLRRTVTSAQSKALTSVRAGYSSRPHPHEVAALAAEAGIPERAALEIIIGERDKLFNACIDDRNGAGPVPAGQRCGRYEACLVCPNAIIVERHLKRLLTYYNFWLGQRNSMSPEAWAETHELNCAIVEHHLRKFDPDVIEQARHEAEADVLPIAGRRFKQV